MEIQKATKVKTTKSFKEGVPHLAAAAREQRVPRETTTATLVDNRPEAVLQRKSQQLAQGSLVDSAVIQRVVALDEVTDATREASYFLVGPQPEVLYGFPDSFNPRPNGLYAEEADTITGLEHPAPIKKWTPNVAFFSKEVQVGFRESLDMDAWKQSRKAERDGLLGVWDKMKHKSEKKLSHEAVVGHFEKLVRMKEADVEDFEGLGVEMGFLGNNDCALFARALHLVIKRELEEEGCPVREGDEPITGTYMMHKFPEKENGCGYHGVTAVATDSGSLVTLEAHAGQRKLKKPVFHIRDGVAGFKRDNFPAGLDAAGEEKWRGSEMIVEHPDEKGHLGRFGSVESMKDDFHLKKSPDSGEVGIRMASMGFVEKKK